MEMKCRLFWIAVPAMSHRKFRSGEPPCFLLPPILQRLVFERPNVIAKQNLFAMNVIFNGTAVELMCLHYSVRILSSGKSDHHRHIPDFVLKAFPKTDGKDLLVLECIQGHLFIRQAHQRPYRLYSGILTQNQHQITRLKHCISAWNYEVIISPDQNNQS